MEKKYYINNDRKLLFDKENALWYTNEITTIFDCYF